MPRRPRHYIPHVPAHIIQRGNNRLPCFFDNSDFRFYKECLWDAVVKYQVAVHAYVFMTNHVHLLMTPSTPNGVSNVIQSVGRRYVRFINKNYQRTGTLWEGRHKGTVVDTKQYLVACCRYIELNPVRAGIVENPSEYKWSSFQANGEGLYEPLVSTHPVLKSMGRSAYKSLFDEPIHYEQLTAIRKATQDGVPLGNDRFKDEIGKTLKRRVGYERRGRPPREK